MVLVRVYLVAGLVLHKVVWEVLKRRQPHGAADARPAPSLGLRLVKGAKIALLAGVLVQAAALDLFPIASDPAPVRAVGLAVYTLGLVVAIASRLALGANWSDIEDARVLSRQEVVARGPYRYIRHPIYTGDILLLVGLELSLNSWLVVAAAALAPIVFWKAVREERELAGALPGYDVYRAHTKRFIPFVI